MEGELTEEDIEEGVTQHQRTVIDKVANSGRFCPSCKSDGGQFMEIENPGESWTQVHCAYGCGYINLDDYYEYNRRK
jgi:hypothetical protein